MKHFLIQINLKEYEEMEKITNNNKLRFKLTEDMNNMMIEMLITQQMLKESKLSMRDRKLLENHKCEVMKEFKKEFLKHNVEQIKQYNEMLDA